MVLLGYDVGSSSIKAALVNAENGSTLAVAQFPDKEMEILSPHSGWAEQDPELWWDNLCQVTQKLLEKHPVQVDDIKGIGIAYQMHGLVLVDKNHQVLRPSIIWCDSRAVEIGNQAFQEIGEEICLSHFLNSPGNFTASKLKWVKDHEPSVYERIHKAMLPGDYIAMKMTGEINTTISGLSEGIFWDFKENAIARILLDYYGINQTLLPDVVPTFSVHGQLTSEAARSLGLKPGIPISYRAGDQPNNALSLNVLNPGEVAATGGTSGVIYGIVDKPIYDPQSRVNGFAHVNHHPENPRIGVLLCINGAGILYSWIKQQMAGQGSTYSELEKMMEAIPIGSDGLRLIPFGNGAERMLNNRDIGSRIINLQFNRHQKPHMYRASLEGIAFSFVYGMNILRGMGIHPETIKVGNDNLFQSRIFSNTIANTMNCSIEVMETTGAVGAAKASGVATKVFASLEEALGTVLVVANYSPSPNPEGYKQAFNTWKKDLENSLKEITI